jgi:hypothetical protein
MKLFTKILIGSSIVTGVGTVVAIAGAPVFGVILIVGGIGSGSYSIYRLYQSRFSQF